MENIKDYLEHIDSRGPVNVKSEEDVADMNLRVEPLVWNPNKGKSTDYL